MRKKGLYLLIVFVTILVVLYVWRYKQSQVFENRVPANATKVININLRQIENHLLFDFLSNPITYLKPRKKKDSIKKRKFSISKGLSVPRNILFYTNEDSLNSNWFSNVVAVNNKEEFFAYLLKEKFVETKDANVVFYTKANFVMAVKDKRLIVVLKTNNRDIKSIVEPLFDVKDFLREDDQLLRVVVNSRSDISFLSDDNLLEANFMDGSFHLKGTLHSDLFVPNTNQLPNDNQVVSLSGQLNKSDVFFKEFLTAKKDKFNEFTHLSLDSIVNKWNGKFHMNINSIERKTDTIVSYEYDDDFNKVEIKSTQEKRIPSLKATLGQQNNFSLSNYFYSKNTIQIIESDTVFTSIPIFKFLATNTKDQFEVRVNKQRKSKKISSSESKLNFYFNAEKYMETPLNIPLTKDQKKFLLLIKSTRIEWTTNNQFSIKINLKDTNRNFLGKLIKS